MEDPLSQNISKIIGNHSLASDINKSITSAFDSPFVHLIDSKTVWDLFKQSLDVAIRDIEEHPRGKLFRRLIEYGPHDHNDPRVLVSDDETMLSDLECGSCVEFIFSHMINRFKGELAELLALKPCISLFKKLQQEGHLPLDFELYWGEIIHERRRSRRINKEANVQWGSYTKGADGLLVEHVDSQSTRSQGNLIVHSIVEVKSMVCSKKRVINQINNHIFRLGGGVKLNKREYSANTVTENSKLIRIMVKPSSWKLSREYLSEKKNNIRSVKLSELPKPPFNTRTEEIESNLWQITLAWSQEALSQAAYDMTFWYMSQVGKQVYSKKKMPNSWEYMTSEKAGHNSIKMMLYYMLLRDISKRQKRIATKLYNIYCFGYPLGSNSKEMLWPEDFS